MDPNLIMENLDKEKLFQFSKEKNDLMKPSISSSLNLLDNQSNIILDNTSFSRNNSSNESQVISNNSTFNNIKQISLVSNEKYNKQKNENTFLGKKRQIHFETIKKQQKPKFQTTYSIIQKTVLPKKETP